MSDYPEHEKLKAIQPLSQAVDEFMEWLGSQGLTICYYNADDESYYPTPNTSDTLLARHFGIDRDKLEAEKRQMLEELRKGS